MTRLPLVAEVAAEELGWLRDEVDDLPRDSHDDPDASSPVAGCVLLRDVLDLIDDRIRWHEGGGR